MFGFHFKRDKNNFKSVELILMCLIFFKIDYVFRIDSTLKFKFNYYKFNSYTENYCTTHFCMNIFKY